MHNILKLFSNQFFNGTIKAKENTRRLRLSLYFERCTCLVSLMDIVSTAINCSGMLNVAVLWFVLG